VSCGTLAASGGCKLDTVKKHCCARCRKALEIHPVCKDVSEKQLRRMVGASEGEGGCPHAAALGKCEKSSLYHQACCASCDLHRDITQKSKNPLSELAVAKAAVTKLSSCTCPAGQVPASVVSAATPSTRTTGSANTAATPSTAGADLYNQFKAPPRPAPAPTCTDMPDADFKKFWHTLKDTHWLAFKHEKSCPHAMMQGDCKDGDIAGKCCKSCTADDGSLCADKTASQVSAALGLSGVSCGTLAASGGCKVANVKKHCCARCRKAELYGTCKDVSEKSLRRLVGNVEGEGGCPHAAAHGKCEKSSLYHQACCATCDLHRDIMQKSKNPLSELAAAKAAVSKLMKQSQ